MVSWRNNVTDALSRDHHSSSSELYSILLLLFQIPSGLIILDTLQKINLWILSVLQKLPNQPQSYPAHQRYMNHIKMEILPPRLETTMVSALITSHPPKKNTTYSVPFGSPLKEQIQRKAKLLTSVYQGQDLCCHLGHLAWAFTASDLSDPHLTNGKLTFILCWQGYFNLDP